MSSACGVPALGFCSDGSPGRCGFVLRILRILILRKYCLGGLMVTLVFFVAVVVKSIDVVDRGVLDHALSGLGLLAWLLGMLISTVMLD